MGKKRNSQKSTQDLLEAAIEVFAEHGPNAATVNEICNKADLNKRMLYHYFGSKENLYQQALNHIYQQFLSVDMSLGSMLLPVEKLIEMIVRQYYDFLYKHQNFVRLICYENLNYGRAARKLKLKGQKAPIITALKLALKKGKAEKRFRKGIDASELMVSILALCFFNFSNRYTIKEFAGEVAATKPAIEKRAKHVADLLLNGIMDNTKKQNNG